MPQRRNRRDRIRTAFDDFRAAASAALGAADRLSERASREYAETLAELWLRQEGADDRAAPDLSVVRRSARLSDVVGRLDAEQDAAFSGWRRDAPPELSALVGQAAPGAAGDDPLTWLGRPGAVEGTGPVPGLWQIGTGEAPGGGDRFRVGVPLLDESHLQVRSTPATRAQAESMVEMLRAAGARLLPAGPGQRCTCGTSAGSPDRCPACTRSPAPGCSPCTTRRRWAGCSAQLSDRIRRVHTRVLAHGHSSLRAVADAEGARARSRGCSSCCWATASRSATRSTASCSASPATARPPACSLILVDVPATLHGPVETVRLDDPPEPGATAPMHSSMTGDTDRRPAGPAGARGAARRGRERDRRRARALARHGSARSPTCCPAGVGRRALDRTGVVAPVGFADGMPIEARLDDSSPHALVGGPSGSGKTNLLLA